MGCYLTVTYIQGRAFHPLPGVSGCSAHSLPLREINEQYRLFLRVDQLVDELGCSLEPSGLLVLVLLVVGVERLEVQLLNEPREVTLEHLLGDGSGFLHEFHLVSEELQAMGRSTRVDERHVLVVGAEADLSGFESLVELVAFGEHLVPRFVAEVVQYAATLGVVAVGLEQHDVTFRFRVCGIVKHLLHLQEFKSVDDILKCHVYYTKKLSKSQYLALVFRSPSKVIAVASWTLVGPVWFVVAASGIYTSQRFFGCWLIRITDLIFAHFAVMFARRKQPVE